MPCQRGTYDSRFHGDVNGSDKHYSFALPVNPKNSTVHLFESAIDLLSYATLYKLEGGDWRQLNLLSLAGVYQPKKVIEESKLPAALTQYLEDYPHIKTVALHLDNDGPGQAGSKSDQGRFAQGIRGEKPSPTVGQRRKRLSLQPAGDSHSKAQGKDERTMKEYDVTITETLKMTVTVEAESQLEAEQMVSDNWRNQEYILDADNFTGVDFKARRRTRSRDMER